MFWYPWPSYEQNKSDEPSGNPKIQFHKNSFQNQKRVPTTKRASEITQP